MGFQHIDGVDGVFGDALAVHKLHSHGGIHHHVREEVRITEDVGSRSTKLNVNRQTLRRIPREQKRIHSDDFRGHGGLGCVDEALSAQVVRGNGEVLIDVANCLPGSRKKVNKMQRT